MGDSDDGANDATARTTCTIEVGPEDRDAFTTHHARHATYLANDIRRMRRYWAVALGALALVYVPISTTGALVVLVLGGIVVGAYGRLNRWWYVRHNRRLQAGHEDLQCRKLTLSLAGRRLAIDGADRSATFPVSTIRSIEGAPAHFFVYLAPAEALILPKTTASTSFVEELRREVAATAGRSATPGPDDQPETQEPIVKEDFVATAEASIEADRLSVWRALVTPEAIKQYMFGAEVESDWEVGSRITWSGRFEGREYEDRGEILRIDPGHVLSYTHFSPLAGKPDAPENYHTVTIELSEVDGTTTVSLSQDNNPTEEGRVESAKNWAAMLEGLKEYVEDSSR